MQGKKNQTLKFHVWHLGMVMMLSGRDSPTGCSCCLFGQLCPLHSTFALLFLSSFCIWLLLGVFHLYFLVAGCQCQDLSSFLSCVSIRCLHCWDQIPEKINLKMGGLTESQGVSCLSVTSMKAPEKESSGYNCFCFWSHLSLENMTSSQVPRELPQMPCGPLEAFSVKDTHNTEVGPNCPGPQMCLLMTTTEDASRSFSTWFIISGDELPGQFSRSTIISQ